MIETFHIRPVLLGGGTRRLAVASRVDWTAERTREDLFQVSCLLVTTVPSSKVSRTVGSVDPACGGSTYAARKSKKLPHFRGFFAPATLPVVGSTTANRRSPTRPPSVTSAAFNSSPIIDFTG